jgi:GxxExxY protein
MLQEEALTGRVIGAAIEVHRQLGPGLLESAYEECLCHELHLNGLSFQRQAAFPVLYKSIRLDCGYRADLIVEGKVVVELKAIDALTDLHKAQLLTYLRISGLRVGLLLNFNSVVLKDNMVRLVL